MSSITTKEIKNASGDTQQFESSLDTTGPWWSRGVNCAQLFLFHEHVFTYNENAFFVKEAYQTRYVFAVCKVGYFVISELLAAARWLPMTLSILILDGFPKATVR